MHTALEVAVNSSVTEGVKAVAKFMDTETTPLITAQENVKRLLQEGVGVIKEDHFFQHAPISNLVKTMLNAMHASTHGVSVIFAPPGVGKTINTQTYVKRMVADGKYEGAILWDFDCGDLSAKDAFLSHLLVSPSLESEKCLDPSKTAITSIMPHVLPEAKVKGRRYLFVVDQVDVEARSMTNFFLKMATTSKNLGTFDVLALCSTTKCAELVLCANGMKKVWTLEKDHSFAAFNGIDENESKVRGLRLSEELLRNTIDIKEGIFLQATPDGYHHLSDEHKDLIVKYGLIDGTLSFVNKFTQRYCEGDLDDIEEDMDYFSKQSDHLWGTFIGFRERVKKRARERAEE